MFTTRSISPRRLALSLLTGLLCLSGTAAMASEATPADAERSVTVVTFWATWCGTCGPVLQDMEQLQAQYQAQGIRFTEAHLGEDPTAAQKLAKLNVSLPSAGNAMELASALNIAAVPWVVVLDANGQVIDQPSASAQAHEVAGRTRLSLNLNI